LKKIPEANTEVTGSQGRNGNNESYIESLQLKQIS